MEGLTAVFNVKATPDEVFDTITDYDRLDSYNDSIRVAVRGDGVGSRCYIDIKKRLLEVPARYTARLRFTEFDEPNRIEWEMTKDLDMNGYISVDKIENGSEVSIDFRVNPANSDLGSLPAPRGTGFDEIISYLYPKLEGQFADFIEDLVGDIEGEEREIEIRFENVSDSLEVVISNSKK